MATRVPWKNRPGFDESGGAVSGCFTIEGTPEHPQSPPIIPIADNVVGWLGTVGILSALRRRAVEGGSYKVTVSLTRTFLWLMSLGIFDKSYAQATAGSSDEHAYIAPDLFSRRYTIGYIPGNYGAGNNVKNSGSF
jgi:crotonobetainyl-CoA:carnitine CoA-transferase CaiB-like acyl-CoA transferase